VNWAVYIAVMTLLVIASPLLGWRRLKSQWYRHPTGSSGVLRDQIVTRIPWAITVIAFTVYTALGGLGKIATPARDWMPMIYGAIALAMFACSGFLPPIMAARQRLTRLSKKPSGKTRIPSATGA
jgi:hypothetical protein